MGGWVYSETVKEHFVNPRNALRGDEEWQCDGRGVVGNMKCGDQMLLLIRVEDRGAGDVISDVRWKTYGCASAIASTSALSEAVKGMPLAEAYRLRPQDLARMLGGLPDAKVHCSALGDRALRAAIDDYLRRSGKPPMDRGVASETVCECAGVTAADIEEAWRGGARSWDDIRAATKIGSGCGSCKDRAMALLRGLSDGAATDAALASGQKE